MRTILGLVVIGVVVLCFPGRRTAGQEEEPQLEPPEKNGAAKEKVEPKENVAKKAAPAAKL